MLTGGGGEEQKQQKTGWLHKTRGGCCVRLDDGGKFIGVFVVEWSAFLNNIQILHFHRSTEPYGTS